MSSEPQSRTEMRLNCAWPVADRECQRKAQRDDYCNQHWQAGFGHSWRGCGDKFLCECGAVWPEPNELCAAKVTYVEFTQAENL